MIHYKLLSAENLGLYLTRTTDCKAELQTTYVYKYYKGIMISANNRREAARMGAKAPVCLPQRITEYGAHSAKRP